MQSCPAIYGAYRRNTLSQRGGKGIEVHLDKHIPDGAGMGGGSADASFVLRALNSMLAEDERLNDELLASLALRLGADCALLYL